MSSAARIGWVIDHLDIRWDDLVVEVGCGHGIAASLVIEAFEGADAFTEATPTERGSYLGIDRSQKMIEASTARNAAAVEAGTASFVAADIDSAPVAAGSADHVIACRVADLARPGPMQVALSWLARGQSLVLAFDDPDVKRTARHIREAERSAAVLGATVAQKTTLDLASGQVVAVFVTA